MEKRTMSDRPYRLCIDPGHGGGDPGAVNKELDILEKRINLAVGLLMRGYLYTKDYLIDGYMTRHKDEFISLQDRCGKAFSWIPRSLFTAPGSLPPWPGSIHRRYGRSLIALSSIYLLKFSIFY